MEPGWEEIFICWWVELPFTRTTTEVWSERNNEIQQIKIQIPAPGTGILHITVQRVSKVLRSSSAQTDQESLVYSRLNMRQCHDDQQRPGCISKNMARKCLVPFTWHLQRFGGGPVFCVSFCLPHSGRILISRRMCGRATGNAGWVEGHRGALTWSVCKREGKKRNLTVFQGAL